MGSLRTPAGSGVTTGLLSGRGSRQEGATVVTFNLGQVSLWALAIIGGLWLLPKLVGAAVNLMAVIWFMLHGDG